MIPRIPPENSRRAAARTPSRYTARMRLRPLLLALAGLLAPAAGPPMAAESPVPAAGARPDSRPLTLDEAVELVKRRYDARVVRADEAREGDEVVYRIRLLAADGRVFTVTVNARSGRVE